MKTANALLTFLFLALLLGSPAAALAHGTHLNSLVRNPFIDSAKVTSAAPAHWKFWGQVSTDVVRSSGTTAGKSVYFKISGLTGVAAVRGVVLLGGRDSLRVVCRDGRFSSGGYRVRLAVELLQTSTNVWTRAGYLDYAHLDGILVTNGQVLSPGAKLGVVASVFDGDPDGDGVYCSSGPHVHLEASDSTAHYAGYTAAAGRAGSVIDESGGLLCVGGSLAAVGRCP